MNFGKLGAAFGKLGANGKASSGGSPPAGTTGQPIGLLLVLTYAS